MPHRSPAPDLDALVTLYRTRFQRDLAGVGIGPGQWRILEYIDSVPGADQTLVATRLRMDKSVVSRAVRALARLGLVEKRTVRGRHQLTATRTAKAVRDFVAESQRRIDDMMLEGFSQKERATLEEYLARATENLRCHPEWTPARQWLRESGVRASWVDLPLD